MSLVGSLHYHNMHEVKFMPIEDDSPYPEVRSAVANFDDPDMPCDTIRSWTIGLLWAMVLPGINQFFYFRAY
jgi:hypothetical protein